MPGAPNRPPEKAAEPPVPVVVPESPQERALRRLAPSRVALLLDSWKGAPNPDVLGPFEKAELAYASGDYAACATALDLLSVRFAEPRWPTLPEPFRRLRVPIPAPVPPHWDPEHGLPASERERRREKRAADDQLALAEGCVAWATAHGVGVSDLAPKIDEAKTLLTTEGVSPAFYERLDHVWNAVRERFPVPKGSVPRPTPATPAPPRVEEAQRG